MKQPKLNQLLSVIQPAEWHWLSKWVRSPFYNTHQDVIRVFDLYRQYAPDYASPKLEKTALSQFLYPDLPHDDNKIRQLLFRLSDLVESFLVAQELKADRFQYQQLLHTALGKRNLYELYQRKNRDLMRTLNQNPIRDQHYYLAKWQLQQDYFLHPRTSRYQIPDSHLTDTMESLDAFFVLSKMSYSAELLNRQNILSKNYQIDLLEESRQWSAHHPRFGTDKVFQIYRDMLRLMEQPELESVFLQLADNVTMHLDQFHPIDQAVLLLYLINTTNKFHNQGKKGYLRRQFNLYQLGLERDLFLTEGRLSDITFLNIIVTATILKEEAWVAAFIEGSQAVLMPARKEIATALGKAYLLTLQGDFLASNRLLRQVESPDLQYLLRNKSLTLRNHVELFLHDESYYEVVEYEAKAFEKFLRRNKQLSASRVKAYLNLITFILNLIHLKTTLRITPTRLDTLRDQIEAEASVVARWWLLEKVEEMGRGA